MICVVDCGECIHRKPLIDGWKPCCDAFPEGIPFDFDFSRVKDIKECNNGIGYETIENNGN